jgi:MFS transporter, OFA family, oxalate/formate antiporter
VAKSRSIKNREKIFYGWIIVLACFGINVVIHGIRYSFGIFFKSLSSEFELNRGATSGISAAYWVLCGIFAILGGWLLDKYGPRKTLVPMGFITGISLIATSQASASWQLYFTYSLLLAAGTGAIYSIIMTTTQRWFINKRGTTVGIVGAGVGAGTITMMPLSAYLISAFEWRTTYLYMGVIMGILIMLLSFPLKREPGEMGLTPDGVITAPQKDKSIDRNAPEKNNLTVSQAIRTRNYWLIGAIWFLWGFALLLVLTHLVPHLTDEGIPATTAAVISGLIGVISMVGRLSTGWISDRLDRKTTTIIAILLQAGALFLLAWAHEMWMFYLFAVIYAIGYGGLDPVTLALVSDIFGMKNLGRIMGALMVFWPLGAGAGTAVGGILFDVFGDYFLAFLLTAIVSLAALVCAVLIKRE